MPNQMNRVSLTFNTQEPQIVRKADGSQRLMIKGYGFSGTPGEPSLPTLCCHVEFPRGSRICELEHVDSEFTTLNGHYRIWSAPPIVQDESVTEDERILTRTDAKRLWKRNYEKIYESDNWYPSRTIRLTGKWHMDTCSVAVLHVHPIQYHPRSGKVRWHHYINIDLSYDIPEGQEVRVPSEDLISTGEYRINPFREYQLTPPSIEVLRARTSFNYVIIVPDVTIENALADFINWKEAIGHSIIIVQLADILESYAGIDDAERVRNYLIEKHNEWQLQYVLLVGDMGTVPTRLLYMNERADAYASDFYFANLTTSDWDLDNDDRWGEFDDDRYNYFHDVMVGRLPLSNATEVAQYSQNVIAFEQDKRLWKKKALFAAGFMDHDPTDGAELCEQLTSDVLSPAGWSAVKLYEKGGTLPSGYVCDAELNQANYSAECVPQRYSLVNLISHGSWDNMISKQCTDPELNCSGNTADNTFSEDGAIPTNCPTAVVCMNGCSTACPVNNYQHVEPAPGGGGPTAIRSLFPFTATHEHNGVRYLRNGAVAAIGASAGADYAHGWNDPSDGYCWSLFYYFNDFLVTHRKPVGDAFYDAMITHACKHRPLKRGVRDFYLMGDPSLIVEGISPAREGNPDVLVHSGRVTYFSAYNDINGDIYVVVSVGSVNENAKMIVYKSTDHGKTWLNWKTFNVSYPVLSIDAIVNHGGSDEFRHDDLLIFICDVGGKVRLHKLPLSNGNGKEITIPITGTANYVSVSHDNLEAGSRLYLGYWYYDKQNTPISVIGVSNDNGMNWRHWREFKNYYYPAIDAGPNNRIHVAAVHNDYRFNIHVTSSIDGGETWRNWIDLTKNDGANNHLYGLTPPTIAASTDHGRPSVWIAYNRFYDGSYGVRKMELGSAYSDNAGEDWVLDQTLASGPGDIECAQLLSYKAARNPWVNAIYVSLLHNGGGVVTGTPRIYFRAVSAEWPGRWRSSQVCNQVETDNSRPRLVYSPGAAGTGGGVVFSGPDGIYFSARWLTG